MTRYGISITKSTAFRNSTQEFSNVYYFDGYVGTASAAEADAAIDAMVTKERPLYGTTVNFIRGRLWKQTADKATTEMLSQKNLSGTGSASPNATIDRERAYLFRLRAGLDSRGKPVFLRKWIHACCDLGGVALTGGMLSQTNGFTSGNRATLQALMAPFGTHDVGGAPGTLVSKNGRTTTAGATWEAHPYL